jgi:hypothetical protein
MHDVFIVISESWEGAHIARTVYAASEDDARQTHHEKLRRRHHRGGSPMNHPCSELCPWQYHPGQTA